MARKLTQEEFLAKAREMHGDKFDYTGVNYVNNRTRIKIKCNDCGSIITPTANRHMVGDSCRKCSDMLKSKLLKNKVSKRCTLDEFIAKAVKKHQDRYDYSDVNYINNSTKISIKCKACNTQLSMTPHDHTSGRGCRNCYVKSLFLDTETFIKKSVQRHGLLYDYSESVYTSSMDKIKIKCSNGHTFFQRACSHISGDGCRQCADESQVGQKREFFVGKRTILYYVKFDDIYKIGLTTTPSVKARMRGIGKPYKLLKQVVYEDGGLAYDREQEIIEQFRQYRYITTDYLREGNNELFYKDIYSEIFNG